MPEHINATSGQSAQDLAAMILDEVREMPPSEELAQALARRPDGPATVKELLAWRDGQVRFWALNIAGQVLQPAEYRQALMVASRDRDEAVRADAIHLLRDIEPAYVRKLDERRAKRLGKVSNPLENAAILWSLARLGDAAWVGRIEEYAAQPSTWPAHRWVAEVVIDYLRNGPDHALDKIRSHTDHEHMEPLAMLARSILHTPEARQALETCTRTAPDDDCRSICAHFLSVFDEP